MNKTNDGGSSGIQRRRKQATIYDKSMHSISIFIDLNDSAVGETNGKNIVRVNVIMK